MSVPDRHFNLLYQQHPSQSMDPQAAQQVPYLQQTLPLQPSHHAQPVIPPILRNPNGPGDGAYMTVDDGNQHIYNLQRNNFNGGGSIAPEGQSGLYHTGFPFSVEQNTQIPFPNHQTQNAYPNIPAYQYFVGNPNFANQSYQPQHNYSSGHQTLQFERHPPLLGRAAGRTGVDFAAKTLDSKQGPDYQQKKEFVGAGPLNVTQDSTLSLTTQKVSNDGKTIKSNFRPTQTKKNARPRINKLNKNEQLYQKYNSKKSKFASPSNRMAELSTDDLFKHFLDILKILKTDGSQKASYYLKMKTPLESQLFDLFVNHLADSIDIFLPYTAFRKVIPELALYDDTNMIVYSIYCVSSLMLQQVNPDKFDLSLTIRYYHQAIKAIRYYLSIPGIEDNDKGIIAGCLLSTILLCIYELFFVAIDSTYIKGASSILTSILMKKQRNKSLLKDSPFYQTCFWSMILCDLFLSMKSNSPNMYSIENFWKPLDPEYFELYNEYPPCPSPKDDNDDIHNLTTVKVDSIWWIHKAIMTFSSIFEFKNEIDVLTKEDFESNRRYFEWLELKNNLDNFEKQMPSTIKPTIYKTCSADRLFPIIYFKDEHTAIVGLNYKLARLALYECLLQKTNLKDALVREELSKYSRTYPAKLTKDIIGIMKTYDANITMWTINIHTIRHIAHYLHDDPEAFKGLEELIENLMSSYRMGNFTQ